MRLKLFAIVVLLVLAGGAVAVSAGLLQPPAAAATNFLTATAATADVTDEVTATGSVAATWTYDLWFGSAPTATAAGLSNSSSSSSSSSAASNSGATSVTWPVTKVD